LKFDDESKSCLESDFVSACGGQSTTTEPQTTKAPINDTIFETACMSLDVGYYSDPRPDNKTDNGTCSQVFMVCTGASPVAAVYECPADLYYDSEITACNYHDEIAACTGVEPASTNAFPSESAKVAPEGSCDDKMAGNYDVENGTCAQEYVACTNSSTGWIFSCPSDLYFDVELNRCDYKELISICSESPNPDDNTTTTALPDVEIITTELPDVETTITTTTTELSDVESTTPTTLAPPVRRR